MATHRRLVQNKGPDFYVTPAWGTRALLKHETFSGVILEPCCGNGAMSEVLKEHGNKVVSSDLHDRGYGKVADFFSFKKSIDNVVTNPPFNIAEEIFTHAFALAEKKVCLLLRTAFVESVGRYERIFSKTPPQRILVFTKRLSIYPEGVKQTGGGTTSYSWFVWDKGYQPPGGYTQMIWIKP